MKKFNKNIRNGIFPHRYERNSLFTVVNIALGSVIWIYNFSNPKNTRKYSLVFCDGHKMIGALRGHRKCVIESYGYGLLPDNSI
jgi:hypothetical protein